jgi:hypothetical protein
MYFFKTDQITHTALQIICIHGQWGFCQVRINLMQLFIISLVVITNKLECLWVKIIFNLGEYPIKLLHFYVIYIVATQKICVM